jgi:hypothetical protein
MVVLLRSVLVCNWVGYVLFERLCSQLNKESALLLLYFGRSCAPGGNSIYVCTVAYLYGSIVCAPNGCQ